MCAFIIRGKAPHFSILGCVIGCFEPLKHLRQLWAASAASIAHIAGLLLRTACGEFVQPVDYLGIAAIALNQSVQSGTPIAPAFVAVDSYQIELADQIREDDYAIAGHERNSFSFI